MLDRRSRVTSYNASTGNGGIRNVTGLVELPSVDNVTGNSSSGALYNRGGSGTFTGPGAVCTTS